MKVIASFTLLFFLVSAPVFAALIQVQELDEAATCELRGAGMVTPAPENGAIFPREENCVAAEADTRDDNPQEGAIEIAGYLPSAER